MHRILIMAGEASGDLHGAKLANALRTLQPDIELLGLGGKRMQAAGVRLLEGIDRLDIIGVPSVAELRQAVRTFNALSQRLTAEKLDAVVLIDNPGLNLRLARVAKQAGHRVIYFVAPQIWAWNAKRIRKIQRYVDLVLVILPFEEAIYRRASVPCQYVGHPLIDEISDHGDRHEIRASLGIKPEDIMVGLLPGSRVRETTTLLPVMLDAAAQLVKRRAGGKPLRFVLAQAASLPQSVIETLLARTSLPITVIRDKPLDVMAAADLLFVASGTATLQSAVIGTPMIIVYRASRLTAFFAWLVIKVRWLGLANLVAGRTIAPELLQSDCTGPRLAAEAERMLSDGNTRAASAEAARELRQILGPKGAAARAAAAILADCANPRR